MDIHKPKPWHGLREFLKEYLIIVVGVLTALGAEQTVELIHWVRSVHDAEDAMHAELHENALGAYFRLSLHGCAISKLDTLRAVLVASRDEGAPAPIMPSYNWRLRVFQSDAWRAAQAMQIVSHIPRDRLLAYSRAYFFADDQLKILPEERAAMDTINTLTVNAGRLQPGERDRLFLGLIATRRLLNQTDSSAARFIGEAAKVGVRLSPADKAGQLLYARQLYGDCVHETSLQEIRHDVGQATAPAEATASP